MEKRHRINSLCCTRNYTKKNADAIRCFVPRTFGEPHRVRFEKPRIYVVAAFSGLETSASS